MAALGNAKRERFCLEYAKDGNATRAYIRSGYSENGAAQSAERLLRNAEVQRRIAELQRGIERRAAVDADWVVGELTKIAKADIRKFYNADGTLKPVAELDDDCAAALSAMEVTDLGEDGILRKVKRWDRVKVLELLGRHFGMWPTKVEHTHNWLDGLNPDELRTARDLLQAIAGGGDKAAGGDRPKTH